MYAPTRKGPPHAHRRLALACGRLAPPPALGHPSEQPPNKCVNQFQRAFLSELILHYRGIVGGGIDPHESRRISINRPSQSNFYIHSNIVLRIYTTNQ